MPGSYRRGFGGRKSKRHSDATTGGRVIDSQDGSRATQGIDVLLAGREGELLMFGNAGGADSRDAERARQLAIAEAGGDEQRAEDCRPHGVS